MAAHVVAATGHTRVPLAPTGSAIVSYNPVDKRDGYLQGHVRRDALALLMFLTLELARQTGADIPLPGGKKLGLWTLQCYLQQFTAPGQLISGDVAAVGNKLVACLEDTLLHEVRLWGFDPKENLGQRLWSKEAERLPTGAKNMVKALRIIRALNIAQWTQTAADLFIIDNNVEADLVDVGVRWQRATKWGAGGQGGRYLHALPVDVQAGGRSGELTAGQLDGISYPQSTSAWVGCDGSAATLTYRLGGRYTRLRGTAGLAPHTPADVVATISVTGDGKPLASLAVSASQTSPLDVDVTGVQELVVEAIRTEGVCEDSPTPYGVLGDAYLVPTKRVERAKLVGTWTGPINQPGSRDYSLILKLDVVDGLLSGTVEYPELGCSGTAKESAVRSRVRMSETITSDPEATCIATGDFVLTLIRNGKLRWQYSSHGVVADGVLDKQI